MLFADVTTRALFPTPLVIASFPDDISAAINRQLVPLLLKKAETEPSASITNIGGWQSDTRILEWGGEPVATIVQSLRGLIDEITIGLNGGAVTKAGADWKIYGWANVNRKGHLNVTHSHPGAYWSASYYVQVDGAGQGTGGEFQILDPRGALPITYQPHLRIGMTDYLSCGGHELHQPKAGQCLLFPSWLPHAVMPYTGDGTRISLAFNFSV